MYRYKKDARVELVRLKDVARRLDLAPQHLAKIVLMKLRVCPMRLNNDYEADWYFWRDVVKALETVSGN